MSKMKMKAALSVLALAKEILETRKELEKAGIPQEKVLEIHYKALAKKFKTTRGTAYDAVRGACMLMDGLFHDGICILERPEEQLKVLEDEIWKQYKDEEEFLILLCKIAKKRRKKNRKKQITPPSLEEQQ
ncbi:MAG: hypothetical protein QXR64_06795 [Pyrobaculum sp.]